MGKRGRPGGLPKTGGRRKGTPNVVTASIKSALTEAFDGLGGVPALVKWGKANPTPFYQCWSRLAPRELPEASAERIGALHLAALRAPLLPPAERDARIRAFLTTPESHLLTAGNDAE